MQLHSRGSQLAVLAAIALGGFLGAGSRFALDVAFASAESAIPLHTLIINVIGSFALGVVVAWVRYRQWPAWAQLGLTTGFLGSFTTFSAIVLAISVQAAQSDFIALVVTVVVGTVSAVAAAWIGLLLGARLGRSEVTE